MRSRDTRVTALQDRAPSGSYALSKEDLLKELQKEREREVLRLQQADAAKTARLRALRLAKESAEAEPAADAHVPQ